MGTAVLSLFSRQPLRVACIVLIGLALSGCARDSDRLATDELVLHLVAIRHNDQLLVHATLNPVGQPDDRVRLSKRDRLIASLNGQAIELNEQWNRVYSGEMPYHEGYLSLDLLRSERFESAPGTTLYLPVSPEFQRPRPSQLITTQTHDAVRVRWTGIPTENGRFDLNCPSAGDPFRGSSGQFLTADTQELSIGLDDLFSEQGLPAKHQICALTLHLRGVSSAGRLSDALGGGDMVFDSQVSRTVLIRHNALF